MVFVSNLEEAGRLVEGRQEFFARHIKFERSTRPLN